MNSNTIIPPSELILNDQLKIYHLNLGPEDIAKKIILVGDQNRVSKISEHFDEVRFKTSMREFVTHTGTYKGKEISAISTGIGCDNIDIVLNELDALVNIDLTTRTVKENHTSLELVRLGTCGGLQESVPPDSFVTSLFGLGFDGLAHFYNMEYSPEEKELTTAFLEHTNWSNEMNRPYFVKANQDLLQKFNANPNIGITATANGFYGPQGRKLRLETKIPDLNERLQSFSFEENRILNFEMETSALYALGRLLGHKTCTICTVVANRVLKTSSKNHDGVDKLIKFVLDNI